MCTLELFIKGKCTLRVHFGKKPLGLSRTNSERTFNKNGVFRTESTAKGTFGRVGGGGGGS